MKDSSLVYSTESGAICPACEKPHDGCTCNPSAHSNDGPKTVRLSTSNKGRKGKTVTIIKGVRLNPSELKAYAGRLKKKTGTGGSVKDGVIEIQGDYREKVGEILRKDGWEVKKISMLIEVETRKSIESSNRGRDFHTCCCLPQSKQWRDTKDCLVWIR